VRPFFPAPKHKAHRVKNKALARLHAAVYDRDNGLCQGCGEWIEPGVPAHHIILKSQGGEDTMENLKMLCLDCHDKKHN